MVATRYLITHLLPCGCQDGTPVPAETPEEVARWLWGREVPRHVVWDGECPYQFWSGDVDAIVTVLHTYPVTRVRPSLPLVLPRAVLKKSWGGPTLDEVMSPLCTIGSTMSALA